MDARAWLYLGLLIVQAAIIIGAIALLDKDRT